MISVKTFLLLAFIQTIPANIVQKCGRYPIESLQMDLSYKSYKGTEPLLIKIALQNEHQKVHVGYYTAPDGAICCVAVKIINGRESGGHTALFKNAIKIMERIQQNLPVEQRRHLVEMIDVGVISEIADQSDHRRWTFRGESMTYGERILIMEMGVESFHERLYSRSAVQYESDRDMISAIKALALPLVEFHKIAIHMDVNPRNYLYVLDDGGQWVLKLIDFEGAQLVSTSNKNECVTVGEHAFTPEYTAPEYYGEHGREISSKFDIWSVGMIVFEILIDRLRAEKGMEPMEERERQATLRGIGNLFFGFTRNRFGTPGMLKEARILYSESAFIEQHKNAIEAVLQLWQKFPKTALLVTNLLHVQRQKRLTAQGILNYIDGFCQIGEFKAIRKSKKLRIFNSVNFGNLLRSLRLDKWCNKAKLMKENRTELNATLKKMKTMLKKVIEEQQEEIKRLRGTAQLGECETE